MKRTRLDYLKMDSVEVTPQGFLRFPVFAGRVGIQVYKSDNGQLVREFRPPEEVFAEATLKSLKGIIVTNEHPEKMVNLDNVSELQKGFGSDTIEIVDQKFQKTYVTVTDKLLIDEIQNGKVEVSLGYDVEIDETPGEFEGMPYDAIQRKIINNHLAVVTKGRAGSDVRLRLDRFDGIMIEDESNNPEGTMAKIKIGDKEFEVSDECANAYKEQMDEMQSQVKEKEKAADEAEEEKKKAEDEAEKEKEKNDSLQAKLDTANEEVKKLKKAPKLDSAEISKLVKERKDLETVAEKFLDKEAVEKMDSMSVKEIKEAVIKASTKSEVKLDDKSDAYIDARYDAIVEMYNETDTPKFTPKKDSDDINKTAEEIRAARMKKDSEAWKEPVGRSK